MMFKTISGVAVLASLFGVTAVMGQTQPPAPKSAPTAPSTPEVSKAPVTGQILMQENNTILAKDLIGHNVYAPDKTKIGSISDLILSRDAKTVDGFVVGVGGFLGLGEKNVALKLDRLQIMEETGALLLTMDAKKEELANAPSFKSKKDLDAEKQAEQARNQPPAQQNRPGQRPQAN
jgi:sporulation protein YlmC with PRC-barrel domain